MKQLTLRKAIVTALATTALTAAGTTGAMASTTMYNSFFMSASPPPTPTNEGSTDGWMWSDGPENGNTPGATLNPWYGTAGQNTNPSDPRPFNYNGSSVTNWAALITQAGDSLQISQYDSYARYGISADIDTAGGAWRDAAATPQGWAHNTDIGLFKSDVTTDVTFKVSAVNGPIANFGITVFTGMDTRPDTAKPPNGYSHHVAWNTSPILYTKSNPFGTLSVQYVGGLGVNTPGNASYMTNITSTNGFTFTAQAGQVYSIYLGGYGGLNWNQQHDRYVLDISTSAVPIPGAVWLMGSSLVGLLGFAHKRKV